MQMRRHRVSCCYFGENDSLKIDIWKAKVRLPERSCETAVIFNQLPLTDGLQVWDWCSAGRMWQMFKFMVTFSVPYSVCAGKKTATVSPGWYLITADTLALFGLNYLRWLPVWRKSTVLPLNTHFNSGSSHYCFQMRDFIAGSLCNFMMLVTLNEFNGFRSFVLMLLILLSR